MIKLDVSDLLIYTNHVIAHLPGAIESALDKIGQEGQKHASNSTLYKSTGHLRKNIKVIQEGQLAKALVADTPYAGYVEFGNNQQGDRIYPKHAKALRFVVDGEVIFRKWVKAHGPIPFMTQAREQMIHYAPTALHDAISSLMKGR